MNHNQLHIEERFSHIAPKADFCSLRLVQERATSLAVRQNILQPVHTSEDLGVMITVIDGSGLGYAGTSDVTEAGLRQAAEQALGWAKRSRGHSVVNFSQVPLARPSGAYASPVAIAWESVPLSDKIDLLQGVCKRLKTDPRIVDWEAGLWYAENETLYLTADGGRTEQRLSSIVPMLSATGECRFRYPNPHVWRTWLLSPRRTGSPRPNRLPHGWATACCRSLAIAQRP